jgi:hypothetical protein
MRGSPSPEIDSRRAAESHSAVMVGVQCSFVDEVLLKEWHVFQRLHVPSNEILDRTANNVENRLTNLDHL